MNEPLSDVAYAKSPEHQRLIESFQGRLKGRYVLAFLTGVSYQGGPSLRQEIERELGSPVYKLDQWYSARHAIVIFDRAARAGVELTRVGELILPAYRRAHPEEFEGVGIVEGFDILERGYREATSYSGVSPAHEVEPGCVRVYRRDSPVPCQYFVGVIRGVLNVFGASSGSVEEVACQWDGAESCCFEARWTE